MGLFILKPCKKMCWTKMDFNNLRTMFALKVENFKGNNFRGVPCCSTLWKGVTTWNLQLQRSIQSCIIPLFVQVHVNVKFWTWKLHLQKDIQSCTLTFFQFKSIWMYNCVKLFFANVSLFQSINMYMVMVFHFHFVHLV